MYVVTMQDTANVGSGGAGVGGSAVTVNALNSGGTQGGSTGGSGAGGDGVTNALGRRLLTTGLIDQVCQWDQLVFLITCDHDQLALFPTALLALRSLHVIPY